LIPRFGLRAPNIDGKPVVGVDELRVILTFNIAYDTSVFPAERHRIHMAGCYLLISYTGARPAELVANERKKPKDGPLDEILRMKTITSARGGDNNDKDEAEVTDEADDEEPPDEIPSS
jgi:hypothetical protein